MIGTLLLSLPAAVLAQDWSSCASELDYLRRRASDASSASEDANSYKSRFERAKEDYEQCKRFPQVYDLLRDQCQSKRFDADSALDSYKSQLSDLASKLDDVDRKVRSVRDSCGVQLESVLGPPATVPSGVTNVPLCRTMLGYRGRVPQANLLDLCGKYMTAEQCKVCLGN